MRSPSQSQHPRLKLVIPEECFHCKELGHWKRNCKLYLASLKYGEHNNTSISGMLVVYITDIFLADSCIINSWVFDTESVAHICNSMQELIRSRSVGRGEVDFAWAIMRRYLDRQDDATSRPIRICHGIK